MVLSPERLSADVARVRPLVGVRALVYQQIVGLGEVAAAEFANELLFRTLRARVQRRRDRRDRRCGR